MDLLTKMRRINTMLQNARSTSLNFKEMSESLCDVMNTNVILMNKDGRIVGYALAQQLQSEVMKKLLEDGQVDETYVDSLSKVQDTMANIDINSEFTAFPTEDKELFQDGLTTLVPLIGGGERLGTLALFRLNKSFTDDDLILAEYAATIVEMEIMHERSEQIAEEARSRAVVQMAISSLSYSELEAVEHIFAELDGNEGLLVASKIADRVGITRSVIVNALRKLESASVIESRSLGMKGTFIKILHDNFLMELEKVK